MVYVAGELSDSFLLSNSIKQGCVPAGLLFMIFLAAALKVPSHDLEGGVSIRFRTSGKLSNLHRLKASTKVIMGLVTELFYADCL